MNWLKSVIAFFAGLFSKGTADKILAGIRKAAPYLELALKLSSTAATILGGPVGKSVSGVIAIADEFGVPVILAPEASDDEIGTAIRDAIAKAIRLKFPAASMADINRAIEIAYGAVKG